MGGGARGAEFAQHQVAWLGLVRGRKFFVVAPPHEARPPRAQCGNYDADRRLPTRQCVLMPGEAIFIPDRWHHATCNLAPWTVGAGGQGWVPGVPRFQTLPPAAHAAVSGNADALRVISDEALAEPVGYFGMSPYALAGLVGDTEAVAALEV